MEEEENREQEEQQAEAVGLPLDERAAWKRVADKRRVKSAEFVQDKDASWGNLMWLVIASPILVLHWKLFKHAKWSTELDPKKHEEPGRIIKEFCIPSLNPAGKVMESLMAILQDASQALRVVLFFHGPLERWSEKRKKTVQQLVLIAIGQLWRKAGHALAGVPLAFVAVDLGRNGRGEVGSSRGFAGPAGVLPRHVLHGETPCPCCFQCRVRVLAGPRCARVPQDGFHSARGNLHVCGTPICQLWSLGCQAIVRASPSYLGREACDKLHERVCGALARPLAESACCER